MHCLILRVPARAVGNSRRMYAANSMGCTKGARCAAQRGSLKSGGRKHTRPTRGKPCVRHGGVAQLGEHLPCKQGVDSSILFISTSCTGGNSPRQYDARRKRERLDCGNAMKPPDFRKRRQREERVQGKNTGRPIDGKATDGHRNGLIAQVVRAHA